MLRRKETVFVHTSRPSDRTGKRLLPWILFAILIGEIGVASAQEVSFEDINPDRINPPFNLVRGSGGRVNRLSNVPGTDQIFYAASEWGGIYKTEDAGVTWKHLDAHLPAATWDVKVNPRAPLIVYATSFYDGRVDSLAGINVSWDGGSSWEHPATATPPPEFNCDSVRREEPSAFGISVDPINANNVYIGYKCGLAISKDAGHSWRFVDPEQAVNPDPTHLAATIWGVVAHRDENGNELVDVCGDEGHFRSADGGRTWKAGSGLPSGCRSIAVSPDESYVLLAAVELNKIWQNVDGINWTSSIDIPVFEGGRLVFVATNKRSPEAGREGFDLWTGVIHLFRYQCTTPSVRQPGGSPRCVADPMAPGLDNGESHVDLGDIAFDPRVTKDACPLIFSSDGGAYYNGVYYNQHALSPDCQTPLWKQPDITPHGLWLWSMVGVHQPGATEEDLYFGTQDNAMFATTRAGAPLDELKADWFEADSDDVFDLAATSTAVLRNLDGVLSRFGRGLRGQPELTILPPDPNVRIPPTGALPMFLFPEPIDSWGKDRFVLVTENAGTSAGGLFITTDNGVTWTELGRSTKPAGNLCAVRAAADGLFREPIFYIQVGTCSTGDTDQLWRLVGNNPIGRWDQIHLPSEEQGAGISIFAVDRSDARRLYASLLTPGMDPRMISSSNGGATWRADRDLDALMQGKDALMRGKAAFRYLTRIGPTPGSVSGPGFAGYPQPSLVAFDPHDLNVIVAGGHDSGVFLSVDAGRHWRLVTDPFDPAESGIPHLTQPRYAYFDHDPPDAVYVSIGTVGRGVWRLKIPRHLLHRGAEVAIEKHADP